jgi:hypothetical protein
MVEKVIVGIIVIPVIMIVGIMVIESIKDKRIQNKK